MEKVILNNVQLDYLATHDPVLKPHFFGTVACDRLPSRPEKHSPRGYIVNTDPYNKPGKHWIALWTHDSNVCEVFDSYALLLDVYQTTRPLQDWLKKHWKFVVQNEQSLQSLYSQSCGDYTLMYVRARARGNSMNDYLSQFSKHDYVHNDHKVGQMLKKLIIHDLGWHHACKSDHHQCN